MQFPLGLVEVVGYLVWQVGTIARIGLAAPTAYDEGSNTESSKHGQPILTD